MDRFKFRAWVNGTMCDSFDFESLHNASFAGIKPSLPFEDYTFMQCTGLKDRHGKLVYEGDIINCKTTSSSPKYATAGIFWSDEYLQWIVSAYWNYPHGLYSDRLYSVRYPEIIGNIYEDEHLLKEKC